MGNESVPLAQALGLFAALFTLGTALTIPLYKFDLRKFIKSAVFIKIVFWIPIFAVFVALLYVPGTYRLTFLIPILVIALAEVMRGVINSGNKNLFFYYIFFATGLAHFALLATAFSVSFITLLITICFATVLSDVAAFFMGNYLGKHKLPSKFNSNKSWEGVIGQLAGAFAGVILVNAFVASVPTIWIFAPIGLGSAMGDLANSYAKRLVGIKDWGNSIPGHGGFLDRFASFAGSALLTFYFLVVFV